MIECDCTGRNEASRPRKFTGCAEEQELLCYGEAEGGRLGLGEPAGPVTSPTRVYLAYELLQVLCALLLVPFFRVNLLQHGLWSEACYLPRHAHHGAHRYESAAQNSPQPRV